MLFLFYSSTSSLFSSTKEHSQVRLRDTVRTAKMRIPYAPSTPANSTPENEAIYDRIRERRKPRPLIPLDLALLHNPEIADGYNKLMGAIRTRSSLSQALAELAICYIAVLNDATYEWTAHAPLALKAGASRAALGAVLRGEVRNEQALSEDERMVLAFTEQSTRNVKVDDELFAEVKERFTDQEVMELMITVAGYNMVSRFLVGLDVTESNGKERVMPPE
ncbi:hypothetical protein B0A50_05567 [Salinomyces thailandicus]|uniref:Carboxymuconolactone decarboxylase-like domain-containing protein n=1 Tax=Salinomyces thailandicus TaxID=706561 RepID=A0A4U0TV12_9PEZI|nr:hypothetical protein B0A50_05567 [Salinomyces thailandica]